MDINQQDKISPSNKVETMAKNIFNDQIQKVNKNMLPKKEFYKFSFEVMGKVTKVYFKKYAQNAAFFLNLVGWISKTKRDTVFGSLEGNYDDCVEMKSWLEHVGSPQSCVHQINFGKEKYIDRVNYKDIYIRQPSTGKRYGTRNLPEDDDDDDDDD